VAPRLDSVSVEVEVEVEYSKMKYLKYLPFIASVLSLSTCAISYAQDNSVIVGKNDWLFVRHEIVFETLAKDTQLYFDLINKLSRLLASNNVTLAMTFVPSKIETQTEQLPDGFKVSAYMSGFNDHMLATLRSEGVQVIDLKKPLREAALKDAENPPFFRLDTHWTNTGAYVAAQALKAGILETPTLKKALDETPVENFQLTWAAKKYRQNKIRDITRYLPPDAPTYPPEETRRFTVKQEGQQATTLLGDTKVAAVALVGSSFSGEWLGFPDALRYSLQRNIGNFTDIADIGPLNRMQRYLHGDAFQKNKPKLLIWEIAERSMGTGPNNPILLPRYRVDSAEWLLQVAALVQGSCETASVSAKLEASSQKFGTAGMTTPTKETDFLEISFDKPVDVRNYFSANLVVNGSKQIAVEAYDKNIMIRKFTIDTVGDDLYHALKTPLSINSRPVNRLKIYPGNTNAFSVKDIKICRYPNNF
jgi:alginate O-acetyltransferase complex protein AlgJ